MCQPQSCCWLQEEQEGPTMSPDNQPSPRSCCRALLTPARTLPGPWGQAGATPAPSVLCQQDQPSSKLPMCRRVIQAQFSLVGVEMDNDPKSEGGDSSEPS